MPIFNRVNFNLLIQLCFFSILLFADLRLIDWYKDFYQAIQVKSITTFYFQIYVFLLIVLIQSLMLGFISYNADLYEASLKKFFVEKWVGNNNILLPHTLTKLDQRIIDDASFASERIASIFPTLIFNIFKCLIFLFLLSQYKTNFGDLLGISDFWNGSYGLCFFGVLYIAIQLLVVSNANSWVNKSENIKRRAESSVRYKLVSDSHLHGSIIKSINSYVFRIIKIRKIIGRAHGSNVFFINLLSNLTIIVPFLVVFSIYLQGIIDFGDLMKISATYVGFQGSAIYVFNFYKDFFRVLSALNRLNS
jgi:ABC-type uncharacterized transport system fused permease/ATPase subunit